MQDQTEVKRVEMDHVIKAIEENDEDLSTRMVMDGFHRVIFHYGQWYAQVEHQFGMETAMEIEREVWDASLKNQLGRLGRTLGFPVEDGAPRVLKEMTREARLELLKCLSVNWLANDGIWFQAVERKFSMFDAKRCNDTCWSRYSPFEAKRIKELLDLPESGGIPALKKSLPFRIYAHINVQSIEDMGENAIVIRLNDCRVQSTRKRKGLPDYPCKSAGVVEFSTFAKAIDPRFETECIACPPDDHPEEWFCAWKFTLIHKE